MLLRNMRVSAASSNSLSGPESTVIGIDLLATESDRGNDDVGNVDWLTGSVPPAAR
jgi:hypothetical protein